MNEIPSEFIGPIEPDFNITQYSKHAMEYAAANRQGLRGGRTPAERAAIMRRYLPAGKTVLEIGSGPGRDVEALQRLGLEVIASDVVWDFIDMLKGQGFDVIHFDALTDNVPNVDGIFTHMTVHHIPPFAQARLLYSTRQALPEDGVIYWSMVKGYGHSISKRTGGFWRGWFFGTPARQEQLFRQEGFEILELEEVVAYNGTPTLHIVATPDKGYKGGSIGEKGMHPYGDVYHQIEAFYQDNILHDLVDAQIEAGLLDANSRPVHLLVDTLLKYHRGSIAHHQFIKESNVLWALALADTEVDLLAEHAQQFFRQKRAFRRFAPAAFAVASNNGFSNIIVGNYPQYLMAAAARYLAVDGFIAASGYKNTNDSLSDNLDLDIEQFQHGFRLRRDIRDHQRQQADYLGPRHRRLSVGVGDSKESGLRGFLQLVDYPVIAFEDESHEREIYNRWGYFDDKNGHNIHIGESAWPRWGVVHDDDSAIRLLNVITSSRFPIIHNITNKRLPLWRTTANDLNENYFSKGDNPLETAIYNEPDGVA